MNIDAQDLENLLNFQKATIEAANKDMYTEKEAKELASNVAKSLLFRYTNIDSSVYEGIIEPIFDQYKKQPYNHAG